MDLRLINGARHRKITLLVAFIICYASLMRTYQETHSVYATVRAMAHFVTAQRYDKIFPRMILSNITSATLNAYREQWTAEERHEASAHWDWDALVAQRNADPQQFQLAIWEQQVNQPVSRKNLHGLAIGRTSSTGYAVRIEYIEGYPAVGNPFKGSVFSIVEMALTFYGFLIDASCMKIVNPLPGVRSHYEARGFRAVDAGSGCSDLVKMLGVENG